MFIGKILDIERDFFAPHHHRGPTYRRWAAVIGVDEPKIGGCGFSPFSRRVWQRLALIVTLASPMVFTVSLGHAANDAPADQTQGSNAMTADGLITSSSEFDPHETMDRVAAAVTKRGITILARIDHAAAAAKVGLKLRPTEVLIFGNPVTGTPLMQAAQTIGIDLPLKMLVWQDEAGKTWVAYNDPRWLAKRHGIESVVAQNLEGMAAALAAIAKEAMSAAKAPT